MNMDRAVNVHKRWQPVIAAENRNHNAGAMAAQGRKQQTEEGTNAGNDTIEGKEQTCRI